MPKVLPQPLPVTEGTFELRADVRDITAVTHSLAFVPTAYRQVKLALDADRRMIQANTESVVAAEFIMLALFDEWFMP